MPPLKGSRLGRPSAPTPPALSLSRDDRAREDRAREDRPEPPGPPGLQPTSEPKNDRVSVALKPDGSVDWDAMRPSTQARVRQAFGVSGTAGTSTVETISPMLVSALLGSVSQLAVGIARMTGHTTVSAEAMRLNEKEFADLVPLWTAALNDYAVTLGRHEKLIVACIATAVVYLPRVQALERAPKAQGTLKPLVQ